VIFSSIKALAYSRKRAKGVSSTYMKLLIATMATTPGEKSLTGVIKEMEGILKALKGHATVEDVQQPTVNQVMGISGNAILPTLLAMVESTMRTLQAAG
jgi:hypothetical protein